MRFFRLSAMVLLFFASWKAFAQTSGTCAAPFEASLNAVATLSLDSRSGAIQVIGTDKQVLRVSCTLDQQDRANEITLRLSGAGDYRKLKLKGGPTNNVRIKIEVPRKLSLKIQAPAGEVRVDDVAGDKDLDLYAGEITLSNVNGSQYRSIDTSVRIGQVTAAEFGVDKGGFFRSFTKETPGGQYRLQAHVMSGSIVLN